MRTFGTARISTDNFSPFPHAKIPRIFYQLPLTKTRRHGGRGGHRKSALCEVFSYKLCCFRVCRYQVKLRVVLCDNGVYIIGMKNTAIYIILILAVLLAGCNDILVPTPPPAITGTDGVPDPDGTIRVTNVTIDVSSFPLSVATDPTRQITATVYPPNATDKSVNWVSSNPLVASVDATGLVTGKLQGQATITVLTVDGGKTAACIVNVSANSRLGIQSLAAEAGDKCINLNWIPNSDPDFDYYNIILSGGPGAGTFYVSSSPPYTLYDLQNGVSYTLRIKAVYNGNTEESGEEVITGLIPAAKVDDLDLDYLITIPVIQPTTPPPISSTSTAYSAYPTSYGQFTSVTRSWQESGSAGTYTGNFRAGKVYIATLIITADAGHNFLGLTASSFTHSVGLATALYSGNNKTATVTVTFPPTDTVTVSGKISGPTGDPETAGGGLIGATVQLKSGAANYLSPVTTGTDGTYTITGVAAGTYTIEVTKPGYSTGTIASFNVTNADITGRDGTLTWQVTATDLTGIFTHPTPAASPVTTVSLSPAQMVQYTASTAGWSPNEIFQPGKTYTATCTLTRTPGWSFEGLTAADFSYTGASISSVTIPSTGAAAYTTATVTVSFPMVQWVDITVPNVGNFEAKLNWIKTNGTPGNNYTMNVTNETLGPQDLNIQANINLANVCITIVGPATLTLNSSSNGSLLTVNGFTDSSRITVVLDNIDLQGKGIGVNNGGPLVQVTSNANFEMINSSISGNYNSSGEGGGIFVVGNSTFTMTDSTISGNRTGVNSGHGGGVYIDSAIFSMTGSTISGNYTTGTSGFGGGVFVTSGTFTMNSGTISGNYTTGNSGYGGGVRSFGTFTMNSGTISGNYTTANNAQGGGVHAGGTFTMNGGTISGNYTTASNAHGGGVYASGTFTMNSGTISGNTAGGSGGGVYAANLTMKGGTISANTANGPSGGGGVFIDASGAVNNFTKSGGTIFGNDGSGNANNASAGPGHAVAVTGGRKRNSTAGPSDNMTTLDLGAPSWEP